jgi:hypothetical protein
MNPSANMMTMTSARPPARMRSSSASELILYPVNLASRQLPRRSARALATPAGARRFRRPGAGGKMSPRPRPVGAGRGVPGSAVKPNGAFPGLGAACRASMGERWEGLGEEVVRGGFGSAPRSPSVGLAAYPVVLNIPGAIGSDKKAQQRR